MSDSPVLMRPNEYAGETSVGVMATQLADYYTVTQQRKILAEWIEFFASAPSNIEHLDFVSRVPQQLLDAVAGQVRLRSIALKWGPYSDISALSELPHLEEVILGGATRLQSLEPLRTLSKLSGLWLSQAYLVDDFAPLSDLRALRTLSIGNSSMGSDKSVVLPDLAWAATLVELTELSLPGTRILNPDLSPLLGLKKLTTLGLPLRRSYRKQVFEFAEHNRAFASAAASYTEYEEWLKTWR